MFVSTCACVRARVCVCVCASGCECVCVCWYMISRSIHACVCMYMYTVHICNICMYLCRWETRRFEVIAYEFTKCGSVDDPDPLFLY